MQLVGRELVLKRQSVVSKYTLRMSFEINAYALQANDNI